MMKIPIYTPWHPKWADFITEFAKENLLVLDVQLGSECNACCPRCDSSCCKLSEPVDFDIDSLCQLAESINKRTTELLGNITMPGGHKNIGFICGLGEPTTGNNLNVLKELIRRTSRSGYIWSLFTNGLYWDDDLESFLKTRDIAIKVQYNSSDPSLVAKMLGVGQEKAATHLVNRHHFKELAMSFKQSWGCEVLTNVAASIVPERDNFDELLSLIQECIESGIFPLIGELENAGNSKESYYDNHRLTDEELSSLHRQIADRFGITYKVPFCPAAIGGIHVDNHGMVTVDKLTGLSCPWFNMDDPEVVTIGSITDMCYDEIVRGILKYRRERIPAVRDAITDGQKKVFGGCGGEKNELLKRYLRIYG